ncbi:RNA-directed DNA polymerase, eukaryota [Tanacetum coccineum]
MICESHYRWFQILKVVMSYRFITSSITTLSTYVVSATTNSLSEESHIRERSEDNSMHLRPQGNQLMTDDDILYKFKEGDFHRLWIQDIEDMLLLLMQGKLTNLNVEERLAFNVSLRMFTRSVVIQRRVEDLQLGVESYQKKLNLTKPDTYRSNLRRRDAYTPYSDPRGFIYENKDKKNRLMRIDELHKFSDGTLDDVRTALNDRLKGIRMEYLPQTFWSQRDKANARAMVQAIDKRLKTRRIMRSLERFVGGRPYGVDPHGFEGYLKMVVEWGGAVVVLWWWWCGAVVVVWYYGGGVVLLLWLLFGSGVMLVNIENYEDDHVTLTCRRELYNRRLRPDAVRLSEWWVVVENFLIGRIAEEKNDAHEKLLKEVYKFYQVNWTIKVVEQAASLIGCSIMSNKFRYLGVMVGEYSSRIKAWDDVILKLRSRLSKWKVKTLSIGGRLTLLKSVLGASPIYNMSIFKVPTGVLKVMESIRSRFFNGADQSEKKVTWVAWNKVLASKKHGGLGVSSFFALNRALLLKWVWRFVSQDGSLWYKVIRALYGSSVETHSTSLSSNWCSIMREVNKLKGKGFDFWSHCKKRIGNGDDSRFWFDCWIGDVPLRVKFPRLFALDLNKEASVAVKLSAPIDISFRRNARGGIEEHLLADLTSLMDSVTLSNSGDRWVCDLVSDGNFRVKEIRNYIDDLFLPHQAAQTRWIKYIPIKVNIFAWRARQDCLPTRVNLIRRGITIESSLCPVCSVCEEDVCHIFFRCDLAQLVLRRICRWWGLDPHDWSSFQEWQSWILSIQFSSKVKAMLEGVFFVSWWFIWNFRNRIIFEESPPRRSEIFDAIVFCAFNWCKSRCHTTFSWDDWLKNPQFISL